MDGLEHLGAAGRVAIVAGHYCISPGLEDLSHEGEAEQASFRMGAQLFAKLGRGASGHALVLWINDIGVAPAEREIIKREYRVPDAYRAILDEQGVDEREVTVLMESTVRNTASTLLRKLVKAKPELFEVMPGDDPRLVRCVDDSGCALERRVGTSVYVVRGPAGEQLVVKDGPNPKCNLILATLFRHLTSRLDASVIVNIFNDIYVNRIRLGVHVARTVLDNAVPFTNVFCDGQRYQIAAEAS